MADIQAPKKKMYRVSPRILWKYPNLVTLVPVDLAEKVIGPNTPVVSVSLGTEPVKGKLPARNGRPEVELISNPATQAQLKYLFEVEHHPHIEEYEE